jgi:hypothetical protein
LRCLPDKFLKEKRNNMRHVLKIAALAALVTAGAAASPGSASAQEFRLRIGPDRDRVERRVIERRIVRPSRRVCRTEIRERIRPNGVIVRRPVEVCTTRRY